MRLLHRLGCTRTRILLSGIVAIACIQGTMVRGQYGASPSQTGMFFDDLRNRVYQKDQQAGAVSTGAIYDYSRGVYIGTTTDQRVMGEETGVITNEAMRQMGEPAVRSGYAGYSPRSAGDYTRYSGPYPSSSSFFAPTYVSDPFLGGRRNLRIGGVNVGFGLAGMLEYNDNITRASENEIDDFVASVFLNVDANYQLTRNNALTVAVTVGFDHYFNHPEVSPYGGDFVLNVLPGSTIAFDVKVGPVNFVIYDRVSVRPATQNDFALDDTEIFGVFQNDAGIAAVWPINADLALSVNVMRSDAVALEEVDNIYDRQMNSVHASLAWSPEHTWTAGIEGGMTWVHYPEGYNNDGVLSNAGVFFSTPITRTTFLRVAGGVQDFSFDDPPAFDRTVTDADIASTSARITSLETELSTTTDATEALALSEEISRLSEDLAAMEATKASEDSEFLSNNRDMNDLTDYYYNVSLSNQLSARVSHTLSFGHESALNTTSNFVTADYVTYGVGIIAWRGSRLSISSYFEDAEESGGTQREDLTQWGIDTYLSHQLNSRVRVGFGYHYGNTDSDLPDRDYIQHAFNVDVNFAVTRKLAVALGYRFWTTNADTDENDFDQNRVILSGTYNFGP